MTITLPPELEQQIEAEVAAGRAKSAEGLVADAVRAHLAGLADLRQTLDEAEEDYRKNGGVPWEDVKTRLAQRLADADKD